MSHRFPGLSMRGLSSKLVACPSCGAQVEVFSDEASVRCPSFRTRVFSKARADCRTWCRGCDAAMPVEDQ